jgi:hypothetical protein
MAAQEWVYAFIIYFVGITVVVSLFAIANVFPTGEFTARTGFNPQTIQPSNGSDMPTGIISTFSMSKFFKTVFSFFIWNFYITGDSLAVQYLWVIRLIFVILPGMFLLISLYYSLPGLGGGGG